MFARTQRAIRREAYQPFAGAVGAVEMVDLARAVARGARQLATHGQKHLKVLLDAVRRHLRFDWFGMSVGQLGVPTMDSGLLHHAPLIEASALLGRPPGPYRLMLLDRPQHRLQVGDGSLEQRQKTG